jgi:HAD superfamily hydrolase (TIGR01509 family)
VNRFGLTGELRGVLLDAGNTLVFLDMDAVAGVLAGVGLSVSCESLQEAEAGAKRTYMALMRAGGSHLDGWGVFMATLLRQAGVSEGSVSPGVGALRKEHDRFNLWRRVPTGLPEALARALKAGLKLGVLSNSEGQIERLLGRVGLAQYFDEIVDSSVVGLEKPDIRVFKLAATRLGLLPKQLVYIGDIPDVDVFGARKAGMSAVLIDPYDHFPLFERNSRCVSVAEVIDDLLSGEC